MENQTKKQTLLSKCIISIFRLNGRIIEWGDLLGATVGLTSARWQILGAVELAGEPLTAPQISHSMGITRQGAQKHLNVLVEKGLMKQCANPRHERSYLYELTKQGKKTYDEIQALYADRLHELTLGLTSESLDRANSVLERMIGNIERGVIHKNGTVRLSRRRVKKKMVVAVSPKR